jgi:glycosyltransferase involved in cell wall biosynthesis
VHDLGYHTFPGAHGWQQRLYLNFGTRWSTAAATRVIAISRCTATDLQRVIGVSPSKVRVVHEGANTLPLPTPQQIAALKERYGLHKPYALYVGTLQPRKNLARLITAYEQLCARGNSHFDLIDFDLVLAGKAGWLSETIVSQARQSRYASRIHLTGYVADGDLSALMAGACLFAFPSLYEGFGLPVLEAQAIGVPVMTAKGSSLPEIAGDAALYVDPTNVEAIAQAMLRLSQDDTLRQELIAKGHRNVQRFSWEKAAAETLAVLEEAARQGR